MILGKVLFLTGTVLFISTAWYKNRMLMFISTVLILLGSYLLL